MFAERDFFRFRPDNAPNAPEISGLTSREASERLGSFFSQIHDARLGALRSALLEQQLQSQTVRIQTFIPLEELIRVKR